MKLLKMLCIRIFTAWVRKTFPPRELFIGRPSFPFVRIALSAYVIEIVIHADQAGELALRLEVLDFERLLATQIFFRTLAICTRC